MIVLISWQAVPYGIINYAYCNYDILKYTTLILCSSFENKFSESFNSFNKLFITFYEMTAEHDATYQMA